VHEEQQEAAGDPQVLQEEQHLDLVGQVAVEHERRDHREAREQERDQPGAEADRHGQAAADLQRDHEREQRAGHAHGLHVLLGALVAADLVEASHDEHRDEQEPRGQLDPGVEFLHVVSPRVRGCGRFQAAGPVRVPAW